ARLQGGDGGVEVAVLDPQVGELAVDFGGIGRLHRRASLHPQVTPRQAAGAMFRRDGGNAHGGTGPPATQRGGRWPPPTGQGEWGMDIDGMRPARSAWRWPRARDRRRTDRKSTRLNSSHVKISYAVFCLKKKRATTKR